MRTSQYLICTLKETPSDAEVISHQLMLRAGLIRKLASGLYSWMPLGLRVLRKVEGIIREEMNKSGAQELLMPVVQPAELWEESGRWAQYGPELLRIVDRHQRDFCLGPTHEEVITDIVRNEIQSYKQLPINLYQIQTKFRDEIRPRFGVMRAREFTMKDSYSFHTSESCLETTYQKMYDAYTAIFSRLGLDFRAVDADTGSIGGNASHEFHVLAESGEDAIAFSDSSDFAANVELAESLPNIAAATQECSEPLTKVETGAAKSIEEVSEKLGIAPDTSVKTLVVKAADDYEASDYIALVLRGDHSLNEIKAEKLPQIAAPLSFASEQAIQSLLNCNPGCIGPVLGDKKNLTVIVDRYAAQLPEFCCGANEDGFHFLHAIWGRDAEHDAVEDLRNVAEGDPSPDGKGNIVIKRGIEVGHIFQLGKKYSEALNATVLNEQGKSETVTMGCYGIGVSRVVAAAIEQNHDENGICWPAAMAPFQIALIPLNMHKSETVKAATEQLYDALVAEGVEVLLDDRNERPGVKFADIELIGIPHKIIIGDKSLAKGVLEYKNRDGSRQDEIAPDDALAFVNSIL